MKLLSLYEEGSHRLGVKTERGILDIRASLRLVPESGEAAAAGAVPTTVTEAIEGGREALAALQAHVAAALTRAEVEACLLEEGALTLGPCVPEPRKIICVGLNYLRHAEETHSPIPAYPILFNKFHNALAGHGWDITLPTVAEQFDYEAELTIVIGRRAKDVSREQALDYVYGYCNAHDLSARDLQLRTVQWLLGKSCDGFCPLGPYLVTADEVGDPNGLTISALVNGEVRQQSHTSDMIFHCDELVSYISRHMTLEPGDIILTGTPEGVILGYPEADRRWLKDGDVVTIEIEKLGALTNRMIGER